MRLNTLEKLYLCLRDLTPPIEMDEELRVAAKRPSTGCWRCRQGFDTPTA